MAVIEKKARNPVGLISTDGQFQTTYLSSLTTAALMLPGLAMSLAHAAEGDGVDFQYGHYQESKRNISSLVLDEKSVNGDSIKTGKSANPIEAETLVGKVRVSLSDRIKFFFNYSQDTWAGATPISTAPGFLGGNNGSNLTSGATPYVQSFQRNAYLNRKGRFFREELENGSGALIRARGLTHIMSTASPETRKQGDFKLSYEWDDLAVSVGGGISVEDDYESRFGNLGMRWDLNNKLTTLNFDLSYTNSDINAILDHDAIPYIARDHYYYDTVGTNLTSDGNLNYSNFGNLKANRQDWSTHLGFSHVLTQDSLVSGDFSYIRSTGYMANPYKLTQVFFADPALYEDFGYGEVVQAQTRAFLERRPETRNQWQVGGRYTQYVKPLDAAVHLDYRFSGDDWGINAHTFEADWVQPVGYGWSVTPRIRYYSQDAADFYYPYLIVNDKIVSENREIDGKVVRANANKLPGAFSSDHRLSGYGALSGGVTVAKQFAKGLALEAGFEYYTHQGGLKIGGGGEGHYADFDFWVANAALKVDLNAIGSTLATAHGGHEHHHGHHGHHGVHAPAGVMFDHMLPNAGDLMVGYRYQWGSQSGDMLHRANAVSDAQLVASGCRGNPCFMTPDSMSMSMHMLDLMYAPTDWLTLMAMPQWMDMNMKMRGIDGAPNTSDVPGEATQHISHHLQNSHETAGFGDLGLYALFKVYDDDIHHFHITPGISAPTGDVNIQLRRNHLVDGGYIHYSMQLGSGTWDFRPSMTYTGHIDDWSWGGQLGGTVRMEDKNESGYRLGDIFQATAWGSYNLTTWLTASVRGLYTVQGSVVGQFTGARNSFEADAEGKYSSIHKFGPQDYRQNYGGRFWDIGFGLSAMVPSGDLAGNRLSVEWLQPVEDDVNGYQLDRDGTLSATWGIAF